MTEQNTEQKSSAKEWLKRIGVAGFLFFFIKGIIWILIFLGLGNWLKNLF